MHTGTNNKLGIICYTQHSVIIYYITFIITFWNKTFPFIYLFVIFVCLVCVSGWACHGVSMDGDQRTTFQSWFSQSTVLVAGVKLRSSGLTSGTLASWVILLAPNQVWNVVAISRQTRVRRMPLWRRFRTFWIFLDSYFINEHFMH